MPEPALTIRPAAEADLPVILELYRHLDASSVALQPDFYCEAPREQDLVLQQLMRPDADYLLAELDGVPAGFALVAYAGWTPTFSIVLPHRYAELCDLVVAPAFRRRGVGAALLAAAKRWTRDRRYEYLELTVLAQNDEALSLYEAQDFIECSRRLRCML